MDEIAAVAAQEQTWQEIKDIALQAQGTDNEWLHGYRQGMVRAYALTTGLSVNEVMGFLASELRAMK